MPEAITKYAVNSSLGTEDFRPLDQLFYYGKSLQHSDNLYINLGHKSVGGVAGTVIEKFPNSYTMRNNGSIRVKATGRLTGSNNTYGKVVVYINGTESISLGFSFEYDTEQSNYIHFSEKDVITVEAQKEGSSAGSFIVDVGFYADVVDTSPMLIKAVE